jgi:hypothetical protein
MSTGVGLVPQEHREMQVPWGAGLQKSGSLFSQIARSCDHHHGLYDDSSYSTYNSLARNSRSVGPVQIAKQIYGAKTSKMMMMSMMMMA